jgi:hypothetical protein
MNQTRRSLIEQQLRIQRQALHARTNPLELLILIASFKLAQTPPESCLIIRLRQSA